MAGRKKLVKETSAGAVIFYKGGGRIYYLLLNYGNGYWGFSKGHIEKNENEKRAAIREIFEETGLKDLKFINGFKEKIRYYFTRKTKGEIVTILKEVIFFLAETKTKKVKISKEHLGFEWLEYKEALKRVTFENSKKVLKKAHSYLKIIEKRKLQEEHFKEKVLKVVKSISKGKVLSYKEVAKLAGSPNAFRAVGNILKNNKDPKVPCHRVIKSDGKIGGYNKGAALKKILLQKEGAIERRRNAQH